MSAAIELSPRPQSTGTGRRPLYRFSVEQYEKMVALGILKSGERAELLEGLVVRKMTQHPPHATSVEYTTEALRLILPDGWRLRDQKPIRLSKSEPEPDVVVARGPLSLYERRHPGPADIALIVEVAESSLEEDRTDRARLYAEACIPVYWIVNLVEAQVEVYTDPRGGKNAGYRTRRDHGFDDKVPVVIDGREVGHVAVRDLLPSTTVG